MSIKKVLNHQLINNVQKFICNTRKEDGMMKETRQVIVWRWVYSIYKKTIYSIDIHGFIP